jgi:4-hydroxybenzoate polyprenyltransferase
MLAASEGRDGMKRPWEKHLRIAIVLLAVAFAIAVFWNEMAGAALAAVALFVALRPLFLKHFRARR